MSLLEKVLKARESMPCQSCQQLLWLDEETPFCKTKDKFILPEYPPKKCELKEGARK
jgi:hypothetical protein